MPLGKNIFEQVHRIDEVVDLHREHQNTSSPSAFKTERERAAGASLVYGFFPVAPGCRRLPAPLYNALSLGAGGGIQCARADLFGSKPS